MADSKLVTYENYTTHCDSRNGKRIQKIFVHHMAGIMTVKDCGRVFKTREASAHYGIDATGAVGQYVHESKRAWSVASRYYDEMAISIELANSSTAPTWKVSEAAIEKCIDLIVEICKSIDSGLICSISICICFSINVRFNFNFIEIVVYL